MLKRAGVEFIHETEEAQGSACESEGKREIGAWRDPTLVEFDKNATVREAEKAPYFPATLAETSSLSRKNGAGDAPELKTAGSEPLRKSNSRPPRVAVTMYLLRQARCAGADWHAPDDWKRRLLKLSKDRPTSPACSYWWHGSTRGGSRFRRTETKTDRLGSSPCRSMKSGWQDPLLFCPPQICFRSSTKSASKLGVAQTTPDRAKSRNAGDFPIFGSFPMSNTVSTSE